MNGMIRLLFLCFIVTIDTSGTNESCGRNESTDIHIIGFFPCTASNDTRGIRVDNCDGIDRIPIMKLALEEINERCDLLPGYRLVVDYANSGCSSIPPVYHLIQQTDPSQPTKLMILGTACSVASIIMGEIAERRLNITQVSYTASSPVFGDIQRYPRFYRLVPEAREFSDGYVAIVKHLHWRRVAVVYYSDDFTLNLGLHTVQTLTDSGVDVILDVAFSDDRVDYVLNQIKRVSGRIIIAWLPPSPVQIVASFWCRVIRNRLAGPDFVWLFPGWFQPNWWNISGINCTVEEMRTALEHSLGFRGNSELTNDVSRVIVSSKNVSQFESDLADKTTSGNVETDVLLSVGYVYDAIWTIALALNSSISILEDRGLGRLENFTYDSVEMANVFTEAVANVSFQGISGRVSFKGDGNRTHPSLQIFQYRNGTIRPVLIYDPANDSNNFLPNETFEWQGGSIPRDAPIPSVITSSLAECVIAGVVSSIGILSAIFFFIFNIYYRKHLVVKRSSYRLNTLILIGVLVGFVGTLLHVIKLDDNMSELVTTTICNTRNWTNKLAFAVAFSTLFVKIWRLYRIFINKTMVKRKHLNDQYLFLMISAIVSPTLVVLIVQVAAFPLMLRTRVVINEDDFSTEELYSECRGDNEFVFLGIYYAENGLIALFSILVAYETQKNLGNYHKYHESAVINLTTILAVLLSSICQVVVIIFRINQIQEGVLLVITLRDCLWMFPMIYLLFIPKVYRVKRGLVPNQFPTLSNSIINATQASIGTLFGKRLSTQQSSLQLDGYSRADVAYTTEADTNTIKCLTAKKVSFSNELTVLDEDSKTDELESAFVGSNSVIANSVQFTVQLMKE
ncbi:gamma-aminobutyric acid type B receptor subunit 1-like isoform X2 [Dysidea avara]